MSEQNYYKILGDEKNASDEDIKKAYRKLAMQYHPDRNKDDSSAEAKFKEISAAYDTLKDPDRRAAYDRFGTAGARAGGPGGFQGSEFSGFGSAFTDIFEDMFGDVMGGGGGRRNAGPLRGSDMQFTLEISLEDAFKGKNAKIKIPTVDPCDACHGSGSEGGGKPEKMPDLRWRWPRPCNAGLLHHRTRLPHVWRRWNSHQISLQKMWRRRPYPWRENFTSVHSRRH